MKNSLKSKLVWRLPLFVALVLSMTTMIAAFMFSRAMNQQLRDSLTMEAEVSMSGIESRMAFLEESAKNFSRNHFLINSIIDSEGRKLYLPELSKNFSQLQDIKFISIVDFSGSNIYSTGKTQKSYEKQPGFRRVLETGDSLFYLDNKSKNIIIVEPIIFYNTPQGALILEVDLLGIIKRLSFKSNNNYYKAYSKDQLLQVYNFDKDVTFVSIETSGGHKFPHLNKIDFNFELGKQSSLYFLPVREKTFKLLLISSLFILLAVALAIKLGNKFSKPILNLCEKVSKGEKCSPTGTDDELEILASKFDEQTQDLKNSKESLEIRVADRTKDLEEKMLELEEFSYRTSHDLKAPLINIRSLSEIMKEDLIDGDYEEVSENLDKINKLSFKLENLISDIEETARVGRVNEEIEEVNIAEEIESIIENLSHSINEKQIEIHICLGKIKTIWIQRDLIRRTLGNLISNSIKYSDPKKSSRFVKIEATCSNGQNQILVSDNGLGIPAKYHSQVFGMFKRFHKSTSYGSGLGLYLVKKNLEKINGRISIKSIPDGTEFSIDLPIQNPMPQPSSS